jgi:hypothetical protein
MCQCATFISYTGQGYQLLVTDLRIYLEWAGRDLDTLVFKSEGDAAGDSSPIFEFG